MFSTTFTKFKKLFQTKDTSATTSTTTNKRDSSGSGSHSIFDCYNSTTSSSGFSSFGSNGSPATSNYSLNSSYHFFPFNPSKNHDVDEKDSRSKALALFTSTPAVTSSSWSSSNSSTWSFFESSQSSTSSSLQRQQQQQSRKKHQPSKSSTSTSSRFQTRHCNKITSDPPPSSSSPSSYLCQNESRKKTYRKFNPAGGLKTVYSKFSSSTVTKPSSISSSSTSSFKFRSVPPVGLTRDFIMKLNVSEEVRQSLLQRAQVVEDLDLDFSDRECSILTESTISTLSYASDVSEACKNEREEIRRRLAMTDDDKEQDENGDDDLTGSMLSNPRLQSSLEGAQNMQICFIPDDILDDEDDDDVTLGNHVINDVKDDKTGCDDVISTSEDDTLSAENETNQPTTASSPTTAALSNRRPDPQHIASRQSQLQTEATLALAQASTMARMQLEVERQTKKKSPIADMVGIPTLGNGRRLRLSRCKLSDMNVAQLQVLVNDLHSQIELLNEDLVHLLIERDDLHMEQDSMLVDIEDLTSHCHDSKSDNNNKPSQNNNNNNNRQGHRKDVRRH